MKIVANILLILFTATLYQHAWADNRIDLLDLLTRKPQTMSSAEWRVQRREAARELGQRKDRRAVAELIKIVKNERFDAILEIAINALGQIGDPRAKDPLINLLIDPSLDAYTKSAARRALKKLSNRRHTRRTARGKTHIKTHLQEENAVARAINNDFDDLKPLSLDSIEENTIAKSLDITIGTASGLLQFDTSIDTHRAQLNGTNSLYLQLEKQNYGFSVDGISIFQYLKSKEENNIDSWLLSHSFDLRPEIRVYPFKSYPQIFLQSRAEFFYDLSAIKEDDANESITSLRFQGRLIGAAGHGRIIDISADLKLSRFISVLKKKGYLTKKIPLPLKRKLKQIWYELRNSIGRYDQLGHSLKLLHHEGFLDRPVAAATTYRLIRILDDPQLYNRRSGLIASLGYGYGREMIKDEDDSDESFVSLKFRFDKQIETQSQLHIDADFFHSHLHRPNSFFLRVRANYDYFFYNHAYDPLGQLSLATRFRLSKYLVEEFEDDLGYETSFSASYSRYWSRRTRFEMGIEVGKNNNGTFGLFLFGLHFGIAAGSYTR